ncbi:DUF6894 family protein [Methylobacterium sp. A54F]
MLKRYHFNLRKDDLIVPDDSGVEAADLDEAVRQAEIVLEEMGRSGELVGVEEGWRMVIKDADGTTLREVQIRPSAR